MIIEMGAQAPLDPKPRSTTKLPRSKLGPDDHRLTNLQWFRRRMQFITENAIGNRLISLVNRLNRLLQLVNR